MESKIAHLGFIQSVIARMAGNSLVLKGAAMALTTAVITVMGAVPNFHSLFLLAAITPIVLFWVMDAQYVRLERQFRMLYDSVREDEGVEVFSMDPARYKDKVSGVPRLVFSWSVFWFYSVLVAILALATYVTTYSSCVIS